MVVLSFFFVFFYVSRLLPLAWLSLLDYYPILLLFLGVQTLLTY